MCHYDVKMCVFSYFSGPSTIEKRGAGTKLPPRSLLFPLPQRHARERGSTLRKPPIHGHRQGKHTEADEREERFVINGQSSSQLQVSCVSLNMSRSRPPHPLADMYRINAWYTIRQECRPDAKRSSFSRDILWERGSRSCINASK